VLVDHPVVHRRLVQRRQVLALEVLDDRDLERRVVVDVLDQRGDRLEAGLPRRAPAPFAGDDLLRVRSERPDQDRLEDAMLADRGRKLVEGLLLEDETRLLRVRFDVIDGNDPDADRTRGAVGRQQADDRR
jgi:hypothetical protein